MEPHTKNMESVPFLDLITPHRELETELTAVVQLYRALGGGWQ